MVTRGFTHHQQPQDVARRIPPGQHLVDGFPVLSAGPAPDIATDKWSFEVKSGPAPLKRWAWADFNALPQTRMTRDIYCVTSWSKLDTRWEGVMIDDILAAAAVEAPTPYVLVHSLLFHERPSRGPRGRQGHGSPAL
jgi:DMSO/TMAO reductase YedYZ molybdopterin-dependent catalytic subunit